MGKTALATNIAFNIAKAYEARGPARRLDQDVNGGIVGFFSLEMSAEQLATRIIAEQAGVSSSKIRRGDITRTSSRSSSRRRARCRRCRFYIDQTGGISIAQLAARARG
jgi:replicative DNA helicase